MRMIKTKMVVAPVKTVFVVKIDDHGWWAARLHDAGFTFAAEMGEATLIIVPGGMRFAERSVPQPLRSRAVVLQERELLSGPDVLKLKNLGFMDIYFGEANRNEFVTFVATTLNHME